MPRHHYVLLSIVAVLVLAIVLVGMLLWQTVSVEPSTQPPTVSEPEPEVVASVDPYIVEEIGRSVEDRAIEAYRFGTGATDLLFVGGIHGGYEWNSSLLAWELIDYYRATPSEVPAGYTLHIIPVLNPDGLATVLGTGGRFTIADVPDPAERVAAGRFNANGVDLNRNFACNWAPESTWRGSVVSAGSAPFSEPEAAALRDYVWATEPAAVAFWHSQAGNVYGSACSDGVLPATTALGSAYAAAGDYGYVDFFDAYPITGDAEGWLATLGIPAITVELESYQTTEFDRNLAAIETWFTYFLEAVPQSI